MTAARERQSNPFEVRCLSRRFGAEADQIAIASVSLLQQSAMLQSCLTTREHMSGTVGEVSTNGD